jgi:hypothetical protein
MAGKLIDEAKAEARRSADSERVRAENEVQALLARRDFLLADVDHLEQYILAQRERLRDAAVSLQELVDRVPGGLGDMRRPLLSASNEPAHTASSADAYVVGDHGSEVQVAAADDEHDGIDPRQRHDDHTDDADLEADREGQEAGAGSDGEHAAVSPAQAADGARSTTIDDVWRSLGDIDDTPASPSAAAVAFDFGLDTSQTPTNQRRPDPDFTVDGDDIN